MRFNPKNFASCRLSVAMGSVELERREKDVMKGCERKEGEEATSEEIDGEMKWVKLNCKLRILMSCEKLFYANAKMRGKMKIVNWIAFKFSFPSPFTLRISALYSWNPGYENEEWRKRAEWKSENISNICKLNMHFCTRLKWRISISNSWKVCHDMLRIACTLPMRITELK